MWAKITGFYITFSGAKILLECGDFECNTFFTTIKIEMILLHKYECVIIKYDLKKIESKQKKSWRYTYLRKSTNERLLATSFTISLVKNDDSSMVNGE